MVYILIIIVIFFGEMTIKNYVEKHKEMGTKEEILKGNILIRRTHNKGAMLNFMEKKPKVVIAISVTMLGILIAIFGRLLGKENHKLLKLGVALLIGGGASNLFDRVEKGYVVDYFSFKWLKKVIFNLGDICIFIGGILILIGTKKR